jgi:hypothetical protein
MLLQHGDALCYALVTDMCGCAGDKASDRIGLAATERAAQTMRAPAQQAPECCKAVHIATHLLPMFQAKFWIQELELDDPTQGIKRKI